MVQLSSRSLSTYTQYCFKINATSLHMQQIINDEWILCHLVSQTLRRGSRAFWLADEKDRIGDERMTFSCFPCHLFKARCCHGIWCWVLVKGVWNRLKKGLKLGSLRAHFRHIRNSPDYLMIEHLFSRDWSRFNTNINPNQGLFVASA